MASFKMRFVLLGAIFLIFVGTGSGQQTKVRPKGPYLPAEKKPVAAVPSKKPVRRSAAQKKPKEDHMLKYGEKIGGGFVKGKALYMRASETGRGKQRKAAVLRRSVMGAGAQEVGGVKVTGKAAKVIIGSGMSEPFDKLRNISRRL